MDSSFYRGGQTTQHLLDENILRLRDVASNQDHKKEHMAKPWNKTILK